MHIIAAYLQVVILAITVLSPSLARSSSTWGQAERDLVLQIHNDYRRNEGGCHINKLEYDMDLERQSKEWAEKCMFKHEMIKGRGENLAFNTRELPEAELITHADKAWFDEKDLYTWGQRSCYKSCHYTQLVWGSTEKIGCYTTRCSPLSAYGRNFDNGWYFVCFYTPVGNWNGETPYDKTCSSKCQAGQTEENGLCVGKATGKGAGGGPCEDSDSISCAIWARYGECENNPGWMLTNCKKSCKQC